MLSPTLISHSSPYLGASLSYVGPDAAGRGLVFRGVADKHSSVRGAEAAEKLEDRLDLFADDRFWTAREVNAEGRAFGWTILSAGWNEGLRKFATLHQREISSADTCPLDLTILI